MTITKKTTLTRTEFETYAMKKVREIMIAYKKYNPNGNYLAMTSFAKEGYIYVNNTDKFYPVDKHINGDSKLISLYGGETEEAGE